MSNEQFLNELELQWNAEAMQQGWNRDDHVLYGLWLQYKCYNLQEKIAELSKPFESDIHAEIERRIKNAEQYMKEFGEESRTRDVVILLEQLKSFPFKDGRYEWIDAKVKLPETSGEVLLLTKSFSVYVGFYKISRSLFTCYGIGKEELTDVEVTHWMEIPSFHNIVVRHIQQTEKE